MAPPTTATPKGASYTPPTSLFSPGDSSSRTQLLHHAQLLQLLHHRNRNQHRRSTWYRHFSLFRRELHKLCFDLCLPLLNHRLHHHHHHHHHHPLQSATTSAPPSSLRQQVREQKPHRGRVKERINFWLEADLIGAWYDALTSLACIPSFAPLSLTLVALLAKVCGLLGVTAHLKAVSKFDSLQQQLQRAAEAEEQPKGEMLTTSSTGEAQGVQRLGLRPREHAEDDEEDLGVVMHEDDLGLVK